MIPDDISKLNRLVELRLCMIFLILDQNQITVISEKMLLLKNIKIFSVSKLVIMQCGTNATVRVARGKRSSIKC